MKKNRLNTKGGGLLDKQKKQRIVYAAILSLFFLVIVLLTIIFWNKLTGIVKDPQSFRERIEKKGWGGKALFVALMAASCWLLFRGILLKWPAAIASDSFGERF